MKEEPQWNSNPPYSVDSFNFCRCLTVIDLLNIYHRERWYKQKSRYQTFPIKAKDIDVGDRLPRGQVQEFFGGKQRERERRTLHNRRNAVGRRNSRGASAVQGYSFIQP
ncbi:hypothetical protein OUZ56_001629 [Daphnia magna]|uniref:Uncharacterized protein n=1 Tax=Daphnia magna TaxID=35525 RepID=A0ABR0A3T2_9CRUS|nr:hypothetical protein OUZ56_001629 [Daphnia magna]